MTDVDCTCCVSALPFPCSGAQGEFAGLCTIMAYHKDHGEQHRRICLVPESAHGTNAASCQMAGLQVVTLPTDKNGGVSLEVFKEQVSRERGGREGGGKARGVSERGDMGGRGDR